MKFLYGKQDWKTFDRGEENCYLMANGLGGFSSLSMIASCSRNDQAVLMACTHSPNHRFNMVHRLEEVLELGGEGSHMRRMFLSSLLTGKDATFFNEVRYASGSVDG